MNPEIQHCPVCDSIVNRLVNPNTCPHCGHRFGSSFLFSGG